jgi:hypothetical protein
MPYERRSYELQWVDPVPRIPGYILNSIVYLYHDKDEAQTGAESGASGFLMSVRISGVQPVTAADHINRL